MKPFDFKSTTNKLKASRIIKFALMSILAIMLIKGIAYGISFWILLTLKNSGFGEGSETIILKILEVLDVQAVPAIGTISTAVIARYAFRESTGNIGAGMANTKGVDQ